MSRRISIDPITRLEGHGKIQIFLNDAGEVENAYFQVPELRGFEKFCEGRPVEELPRITTRICGVCPEAHHMASGKAVDAVYHVQPTSAARKLRELLYNAFYSADHCLHFYILAAPDFVMGPDAPIAERNILGIIGKVGLELGGKVIRHRKECHEIIAMIGGKAVHPVCNLPGGVSSPLTKEQQERILEIAKEMVEFSKLSIKLFNDIVLGNSEYVDMIQSNAFRNEVYDMGLVDENNKVNYYDGMVRVTNPRGEEVAKFAPHEYLDYIAEHVEPWTYLKFPYLKTVGWKGLVGGMDSGIYRVAPLGRLNASEGMSTPAAQEEYERFYDTLGPKPVHATLATHWARLIEMLNASERCLELAQDPEILSPDIRAEITETPDEGVGIVEAPRGTLIHHYWTDDKGIVQKANLIVGTTNNYGSISLSIKQAAKELIKGNGEISEGLLNRIEMAFRAYDPCLACATHSLPGKMPLIITVYDSNGQVLDEVRRD